MIEEQSLRQVPRQQLFISAMEGMLKDLDEHSMYISGDMFKQFDEEIRQEFGGVGMYVETDPKSKLLTVLAAMPGTPAFDAGLRSGDQIVEIDGAQTAGLTRRDAIKLLRGPIGKPVELKVVRGEREFFKSLNRAAISVPSVHGDFRQSDGNWRFVLKDQPNIGYIRLVQFGEKSAEEFAAAIQETGKIDGLIIDLRNNAGGLLDVAIEICDMLLPAGKKIVSTRGRNMPDREAFSTEKIGLDLQMPVCVIVNRNSASASEVVAGCLQDHGRAILVGEQSWGKGTVQNVIPIQRGESAMKLTTSSYWRPSGVHIDRYDEVAKKTNSWGVHPDDGYDVEQTDEDVFNNIRVRSLRELEGLLSPEQAELVSTIGSGNDGQTSKTAPDSDSEIRTPVGPSPPIETQTPSEDVSDEPPEKPIIDRPLQRAIEYFQENRSDADRVNIG